MRGVDMSEWVRLCRPQMRTDSVGGCCDSTREQCASLTRQRHEKPHDNMKTEQRRHAIIKSCCHLHLDVVVL